MTTRRNSEPLSPQDEAALRRMILTEDDLRAMLFSAAHPPALPDPPLEGSAVQRHRARERAGLALYRLALDREAVVRVLRKAGLLTTGSDRKSVEAALRAWVADIVAAEDRRGKRTNERRLGPGPRS